jgi:ABC-type glutathione transport system ATPase component
MVGLKHRLDHVPSQMSGGEQQRTTIARAIANNPELLLLDEPTGDLDTVNTLIAMKLLTKLNKEEKITMLMVTHDVALKSFADRVIWMRDGKIQRIEVMPSWKKEEAIAKLDAQLKEVQRKRKEKAKLKKERQKAKKKGEKGAKDEIRLPTEVRMPTDYETHPRFVQRDVEFTETRPDVLKRLEKKKQKKANHSKESETSSTRTRSGKGNDSESEEENSQEKDSIDIVIEQEERAKKAGKKEKKDNKKKGHHDSDEESDEDESDEDEEDSREATSKYTFRED